MFLLVLGTILYAILVWHPFFSPGHPYILQYFRVCAMQPHFQEIYYDSTTKSIANNLGTSSVYQSGNKSTVSHHIPGETGVAQQLGLQCSSLTEAPAVVAQSHHAVD